MAEHWRPLTSLVPGPGQQIMAVDEKLGEVIVVSHEGLHAYRNSCPHIGVGLDYGDGDCLVEPGILLCSLHGARFRAEDGFCFDGPCAGDALSRIPIRLIDDRIEVSCTTQ
ncbi:MAG: Rieske (2Fe-2S) protein [Planctomycetota bacterium]|nr:MAG: Rieske (2Fe-2S) protein [Planctomycetota bacterium]